MSILQTIHGHDDLIRLDETSRQTLCRELREELVQTVSHTGGHLASNLGVVELTVALETVFDTSKDRLVFDVGHQSYVHKLLTGRQAAFSSLRQFGGVAGFPKPSESDSDAFVAGHASSSVSIALGMARARSLQKQDYSVVALFGDGAATGGMIYEGLNDVSQSKEPMVMILNDNGMSIDWNVGGMAMHLSRLRSKESYLGMKIKYREALEKVPGGKTVYRMTSRAKERLKRLLLPGTIFENMGLTYLGPVDGHDCENLIALLRIAKQMGVPVLLHVMTQKGKGYAPAEENPAIFHGVGKFDPATGEVAPGKPSFSSAFGKTMCELAQRNKKLCAITAAMPGGTGLLGFKEAFPKRTFDVGIAEEHAMSMAGGLAKQGMVPVVALYSTFLQRAYDMILQDIAMLKLHCVIAVDRAGLVGDDGETHHGVFDVGFLRQAPGLCLLAPGSLKELEGMLTWAVEKQTGPAAIRYPRGGDRGFSDTNFEEKDTIRTQGLAVRHRKGKDVTIVTYGVMLQNAMQAASLLAEKGIEATVIRCLTLAPLPVEDILRLKGESSRVFILEEACAGSGIKEALAWELRKKEPKLSMDGRDLGGSFVPHGSVEKLHKALGLDPESICKTILEGISNEN